MAESVETIVNFPFLKQGMNFTDFSHFNVLFEKLKITHNLQYKYRSTRYLANDKKIKGKNYNIKLSYSEWYVQCKNHAINPINGVLEECPSEIKLAQITVFNMRHNHKILKIGENEDECDRLKIIEEITTRLSAVLFNMYDEEFTKHIQVLNNIIGGEIEEPSMQYDAASDFVETSYSKKSTDTLPQEVPSKSNDKLSDNNNENSENPEMKTSKSNYNLLDENTSENFEVEFEISKKLLEDTDQKTLKTPIKCLQIQLESNKQFVEDDEEISIGEFSNLFEKKSKSSQSTAMEFQSNSNLSENYKENCEDKLESNSQQQFKHVENSKSNDTKSVKNNEQSTGTTKKVPLQQVKKSSRKIKKKEPFSPTIEKKHVTIDGTKKNVKKNESLKVEILKRGIKQTTTKVQSKTNEKTISEKDCQDLINKYRQKIVENVQDSRNASIDDGIKNLNIRKEVNVESSTKSAFVDMNRYKKKVTMMKWLNVNDIAINSSMKGEYFIQSEDLSNPTAQFLEISENDLRLLQDHLSAESYASLIDEIKVKRKLKWICLKCNQEGMKRYVSCASCLQRFHYKCINVIAKPKNDWYCSEVTCNILDISSNI